MREYIIAIDEKDVTMCFLNGMRNAELIRCKDCKYFTSDSIYGVTIPGTEYCIFTMNNRIEENDYCSRAERKEE